MKIAGYTRQDIESIAEGLECYEQIVNVGPVDGEHDCLVESTTMAACLIIREAVLNDGWLSVEDNPPPVREFIQVYIDHSISPQMTFIRELRKQPLQIVTVAQVAWYDNVYGENEVIVGQEPRWMLTVIGGGPMGYYENVTHWKPLSAPPVK